MHYGAPRARRAPSLSLFAALLLLSGATLAAQAPRVLYAGMRHLGDSRVEKWPDVPDEPQGKKLSFAFKRRASRETRVLVVRHYHVDDPWKIVLNGREIGRLERKKALGDYLYVVPAGALRNGENRLTFVSTKATDDIAIGRVRLHERTLRAVLDLHRCVVRVRDDTGRPIPARVCITNAKGEPVELYFPNGKSDAMRPGICYSSKGEAVFEVPRGDYSVDASRGFEWSRARTKLESKDGGMTV